MSIRTTQPQNGPYTIDWSNPITNGLVEVILPHVKESLVTRIVATSSGSITTTVGKAGLSRTVGTEATTNSDTYAGSVFRPARLTYLSYFRLTQTPGGNYRLSGNFASATSGYAFSPTPTSFRWLTASGSGNTVLTGSSVHTRPTVHVGSISGGLSQFWEDGVRTSVNNSGSLYAAGTVDFSLGSSAGSTSAKAEHFLDILWNRPLSSAEIRQISANPWQIFTAIQNKLLVPVSTSLNYTITPTGSITFSGNVEQVHTKVYSPSGSVIFSGTAGLTFVGGSTSYTITPSGTITYSGAASTSSSRVLYPTGSLVFSDTSKLISTHVMNTSGDISFTGTNNFTKVKVFTSSGTLTFTGEADLYMPGATVESTKLPLTGVGS